MKTSIKIIFTIFSAALIIFLIYLYRQIEITSIVCKNQYEVCNKDLSTELSQLIGKSVYQAREEIKKILDDKVYIKTYSIYYYFPEKIEVNTIVRKPKFSLHNGENYLMVDAEGRVLTLKETTVLPSLYSKDRFLNIGEVVRDEELFSLNLLFEIQSLYKVRKAVLEDNKLLIYLQNGYEVVLPINGDKEVLTGSLILIIDSLKNTDIRLNNDINVQIIDLRFKNPVLK